MEWIRRLIKTIGIAAHILRKATLRSAAVIGLGRTSLTFLWIWSHKCSIGFKSGLRAGPCNGVLLEKVPGGSGSVGAGIILLEHVVLVTAKIGLNVKSKDLIDIPQSRDAIPSTWANILKGNRSSFMTDPDGFPDHDALPTRWVSPHTHTHTHALTFFSPDPYSAIRHRNTEPTFIW